jgi:phage shock protein PspC (stress-responsive transcriptional regulator)/predicted membrane protein
MNENTDAPRPEPRLTRSHEGRLITGVCAGLARYTRIDPLVFRVAFALLVITTGIGILLYIVAFLLMGTPDGGPSRIERFGKRIFDGDTALALLGAALAAGVVLGLAGNWGSGDALSVIVVFGLTLLVARSRGVDLVQLARSMPDRIKGRPLATWTPSPPAPVTYPDGMVDLARLGRRTDTYATGPYGPGAPPEPSDTVPTDQNPTDPYGTTPYVPAFSPRPRSYLSLIILLLAIAVGGLLYAAEGEGPHFHGLQVAIAGALVVVALGLVIAAWFGRDHKLVLVGAIMSLALASTSIAGNAAVARQTYHTEWRPAAAVPAEHNNHRVIVGQGMVDLTTVPLSPGQRLEVTAEVVLGVLSVKVPSTARVEVDGRAFLGDITVDHQVTSGPRARVRRVLPPENATGDTVPPTIALYIRSKVGDMEVTRVPA